MGAPMRRPNPKGPVLDAHQVAELLGHPVDSIYAMVRTGEIQPPVNPQRSPRSWRWSRQLMTTRPYRTVAA